MQRGAKRNALLRSQGEYAETALRVTQEVRPPGRSEGRKAAAGMRIRGKGSRDVKASDQNTIYTVGHSTHSMEELTAMLKSFGVTVLVDIRHFPGSRKYPHFNKENLAAELEKAGISYVHMEDLGGRRKVRKDSKNSRWRNESFRGYADYMETEDFEKAAGALEAIALKQPTAYMCSEAVWWRCHRSMVSDYLKARGWRVLHIMAAGKAEEHAYTSPARVEGRRVYYSDGGLFDR